MDPLSAARALLPAWLPFASFLSLPLGALAGWLAARALTPFAYRKVLAARDAPGTERARLGWPARKWASLATVVVPAVIGAFVAHLGGPISLIGRGTAGFFGGTAALAGYAMGMYPGLLRLHGPSIGGRWRSLAIVVTGTLPAILSAPLRRALGVSESVLGPPDDAALPDEAGREVGPAPPPPASGRAGRIALVVASVLVFVAAEAGFVRALPAISRRSPIAAVALTGGDAWALSELARATAAGGKPGDAVALYRAAFFLDGRPGHLADATFLESRTGRCAAARDLAAEAGRAARRAGTAELDRYLAGRAADVAAQCGKASRTGDGDDE